ncbi:MAG: FAD-dependent oxidoreductase [Methylobacteriaceae bacterium]|nr:FAD-dependent oxidoreductase [Methylobacteriaceae bacterium]
MPSTFPHLFSPLALRHKTLKNRITFGAHTANMSEGGLPSERHLAYYIERARGGAAMIVVEPIPVHRTGVLTRGNFRHDDDAIIAPLRRIAEACHAHGAVMIQQLYHVGAHDDWDLSFEPNWSPSGAPSFHDSDGSHAMSIEEIDEVIEGFVRNAGRARAAGFDGVELMAAYNALIEQFWSPLTNRREDRYGGSFDNRMRFSTELLQRLRARCGEDFIIGMAISVDETVREALSRDDHVAIAAYHDARGLYDYVSIGSGSYFNFGEIIPTFLHPEKLAVPPAEAIRQAVRHIKVQVESRIRTPENAESVVAAGQADLVSIVRGQIADPDLVAKARAGRAEDIRPCISCNQMCWGRRSRDYWISCLVNPSAGREFEEKSGHPTPRSQPKRVLVVGGGPAGLEAARVAARHGHRVMLAEMTRQLGGQFRLAGLQPQRSQILDLIAWYERQLAQMQVELKLDQRLDAAGAEALGADCVILATGSRPAGTGYQRALPGLDRLPGVEAANVFSVEDAMTSPGRIGMRVLVLDDTGSWRGGGTAFHLAERGHAVTIVTPDAFVGREIVRTAGDGMLRRRLAARGTTMLTEAAVTRWTGTAASIRSLLTGGEEERPFDALILATTNVADDGLADDLASRGIACRAIGDCLAPRHASAAILEGRRAGLAV